MVIKPIVTKGFRDDIKKFKDKLLLERIEKQIRKIAENPKVGKPLGNVLKGERSVYIKPFRLVYSINGENLFLLRFKHRKDVYKKAS